MDAINPCPDAISFRHLAALYQQAPTDNGTESGTQPGPHDPLLPLQQLLQRYAQLSQQLNATLEQSGAALEGRLSGQQLLALGAFRAHLQMGLRALAASQHEN
jgi:hypothetical protein